MKKENEKEIVKQALQVLTQQGYFCYKTWGNIFEINGRADITGLRKADGKRLEYELKKPTGRLSIHQKSYLSVMYSFNAIIGAADNIEDLLKVHTCKNPKCIEYDCLNGRVLGNICPWCGKRK